MCLFLHVHSAGISVWFKCMQMDGRLEPVLQEKNVVDLGLNDVKTIFLYTVSYIFCCREVIVALPMSDNLDTRYIIILFFLLN